MVSVCHSIERAATETTIEPGMFLVKVPRNSRSGQIQENKPNVIHPHEKQTGQNVKTVIVNPNKQ